MLLFQPYLDRIEEAREKTVQVAVQRGLERAAVDGYFTGDNINDMLNLLAKVGYKEEDVEFKGTLAPTDRGQYIEASIKVPNQYQYLLLENLVLDGEDESDNYHYHYATRMSEYIE